MAVETSPNRLGQRGYTATAALCGLVALFLFPPVFGGLAIYAGYVVHRRHHEFVGLMLMAWGAIGLVLGFLIGMAAI